MIVVMPLAAFSTSFTCLVPWRDGLGLDVEPDGVDRERGSAGEVLGHPSRHELEEQVRGSRVSLALPVVLPDDEVFLAAHLATHDGDSVTLEVQQRLVLADVCHQKRCREVHGPERLEYHLDEGPDGALDALLDGFDNLGEGRFRHLSEYFSRRVGERERTDFRSGGRLLARPGGTVAHDGVALTGGGVVLRVSSVDGE